jgi:hypothetical protein
VRVWGGGDAKEAVVDDAVGLFEGEMARWRGVFGRVKRFPLFCLLALLSVLRGGASKCEVPPYTETPKKSVY